ncbi:MAG: hypothetical protein GWN18_18275 [Thermoplasmata archaeon]|nr:hypothetical protein [Thermoplasmata archaeon]NIS14073.1 hypothetical protein [Thermoplasmata archaeon]NIS21914.1 hypothetical protein [Thermoplasmata archaeon]NIT79517.1 hypothetical protein [Thermoplasmata archaeon]NIU50946.1 hypothetical protein [Thermoplasmata archaeon]
MGARGTIIAITVALALTIVACPALAGEESGTETIFGMDPFSIEIEATGNDEMRVAWDIKVTDGVPVNIVLLDEENHDKFTSYLRYEAYKGHEYNYTNSSKKSVKVEEGTYFLAIESAHSSMDSSTVDYEVKWREDSGLFDSPWCWPLAIILAILLAIFGALAGRRRTGGEMTMTPRPGEVPASGTGDVAELSPQPEPPSAGTGVTHPPGEGAAELGPQPEPPDMPSSDFGREASPDTPSPRETSVPAPSGPSTPAEMPHDGPLSPPEYGPPPDEPAPGTGTYISPAPPADMAAPGVEVPTPPGEPSSSALEPVPPAPPEPSGATHLSPQPEPPDMPPSPDKVIPTGEGATELSPQPEPPDMPSTDAFERTVPDPLNPDAETHSARDMPSAHMSPEPTSPGTSPPTDATADASLSPEPPDPPPEPNKVKLPDPDADPDGEPL